MPATPVNLWEKLVTGGMTLSALFAVGGPENWRGVAADDAHADPLPCGLRISIVRVAWEVGGQTHELTGPPAETGAAPPFLRPKQLHEIQLTGQMGADRICLLSGFIQYDDLDLHGAVAEAGKRAAGLLVAPAADWQTFWDGTADREAIAAACRNVLRLGGGPAIVAIVTATPDRLPHPSADALVSVLRDERSSPEWAGPFLALHGPFGDAALICVARQAKEGEENEKDFLRWVAAPADHSAESVQAACCALIDLGRPSPELNALIDKGAVKAFPEVRSPRGSLMFPPQTAQTVLEWLLCSGTAGQRVGAAVAAVAEGKYQGTPGRGSGLRQTAARTRPGNGLPPVPGDRDREIAAGLRDSLVPGAQVHAVRRGRPLFRRPRLSRKGAAAAHGAVLADAGRAGVRRPRAVQ